MDSEQDLELEKKIDEVFENAIKLITEKDYMAEWSLLRKILFYISFTLLFFVIGLLSIAKKIIFFRFSQIPIEFKIMGKLDNILRKYLMF